MKKIIKSILLTLILFAITLVMSNSVKAVKVNASYNKNTEISQEKNIKIKPGQEVWVSVSLADETKDKVMLLSAELEYDHDILELVKNEELENSAQVQLGEGWNIGNVNLANGKILTYSESKNRSNNVAFIKLKVKENVKAKSTTVTLKDIVAFNESTEKVSLENDEIKVDVKLKKSNFTLVLIIATVIVIGAMGVYFIFKKIKK